MSYRGLGYSFSAGGSVKYGDRGLRTSGGAEAGANVGTKLSSQKAYAPVTDARAVDEGSWQNAVDVRSSDDGFPWMWVGVGTGAIAVIGLVGYAVWRKP